MMAARMLRPLAEPRGVRYRDRGTGEIRTEIVWGEEGLRFLYERPIGRMLASLVLRREPLSRLYGWFPRSRLSRGRIRAFAEGLRIDVAEASRPLEDYRSLDDFFTRALRPEARPVDPDPDHLISPADGRVLVYPEVDGGRFVVKGCRIALDEMLGGPAPRGGAVAIVRLAPPDYHRFHFPDDGVASRARTIGGGLHSVNPIALESGANGFRNKRAVTRVDTRGFGQILLVEVGALIIGAIEQTYRPGPVRRGQEKGYFHFGGSTFVMVLEPGRVAFDEDLVESSREGLETYLKFGSNIGRRSPR